MIFVSISLLCFAAMIILLRIGLSMWAYIKKEFFPAAEIQILVAVTEHELCTHPELWRNTWNLQYSGETLSQSDLGIQFTIQRYPRNKGWINGFEIPFRAAKRIWGHWVKRELNKQKQENQERLTTLVNRLANRYRERA